MKAKMKLGIHTAMAAGKLALTAMLDTTVWNMMYVSMRTRYVLPAVHAQECTQPTL